MRVTCRGDRVACAREWLPLGRSKASRVEGIERARGAVRALEGRKEQRGGAAEGAGLDDRERLGQIVRRVHKRCAAARRADRDGLKMIQDP